VTPSISSFKNAVFSDITVVVIDGWGVADTPNKPGDAISAADTPVMDGLRTMAGYTELEASSLAVGLPEGLMGNSEVGHLNIGAGRVVWQDVVRIDQTMKQGDFLNTRNIIEAFEHAKHTSGRLHLLGLVSDGGVHSHNQHLYELLITAKKLEIQNVFIHFFGDGRDTDPKSSKRYMEELLAKIKELGMDNVAKIGTVVGRSVNQLRILKCFSS
jgi:2,3-bisphosphoglycerate-independent phosphoglycerate mutase